MRACIPRPRFMAIALVAVASLAVVSLATALRLSADDKRPALAADQLQRLIAALGSNEYAVREAATDDLARIGLPAFSALEAAANHPDREVRYRSQRVLGLIRQHDQERRLEAFLSGADDGEEYPLPGWRRFRRAYGDDTQSRTLFVEIQRADHELMQALEAGPREAAAVLAQRTVQTQQALQAGGQALSLGQVAASLFVAAEEDVTLPAQALSLLFSQCFQPAVREAISGSARREIPRKMLAAIVRRSEDYAAYQAMNVAAQFNMPEAIVPAEKILASHGANRSAHMAQYALLTMARLGDASHLPLVAGEKLLSDATQVGQFQENGTTYVMQLRDVALAAAIVLSKQDLKAYFPIPPNQTIADPQTVFLNARLIGFESEEKRAAVFAKWAEHQAEK